MTIRDPYAREYALEDFLDENPDGSEVSFLAGWEAAMQESKRRAISKAMQVRASEGRGSRKDDEITRKYTEAKAMVLRGFTKAEACLQVGLSYDGYMRRQRMEIHGFDRRKTVA